MLYKIPEGGKILLAFLEMVQLQMLHLNYLLDARKK